MSIIFRVETRRAAARHTDVHMWTPSPTTGRYQRTRLDLTGPTGIGQRDRLGLWQRIGQAVSRLREHRAA